MLRFRSWAALVAVGAALGCGSTAPFARVGPAPPIPAPRDTACDVVAGPAIPTDSIVIALAQPVDPAHAPAPENDAERLVFRQLYETLIRVDCLGRVVLGLAQSWTRDATGGRWAFTLRRDARFWDGAPVTARDVVIAWGLRDSALARAATVTGERALTVTVSRSADSVPIMFADPALAVAKPAPAPAPGWPIGTGRLWVTSQTVSADAIRAVPMADAPPDLPAIAFRLFQARDARDALDERLDVLVTDDPAVLDYAAARPEYVSLPLTWDRTYGLLVPSSVRLTRGDLDDLRQAVHVDARAAEPCDVGAGDGTGRDGSAARRIVYRRDDRTARDLADRLVARSLLGRGTVAVGLAEDAFAASLAGADGGVYVVSQSLHGAAGRCRAGEQGPFFIPLLDTRSHAVVRRGLPRFAIDWDGTLRLTLP